MPYILLAARYKVLIACILVLCVAGTGVRMFLRPKIYMAKATILPSGGQAGSGVMGLIASVTGGPAMVGSDENSSVLFPRILESRMVGLDVLKAKYRVKVDGRETQSTLYDYFKATDEDGALLALKFMRAFDVDRETGLITVSVNSYDPMVSAQVANNYVDALERFNADIRKQTATDNTAFLTQRVADTSKELVDAEERLAQFKQHNMRINSPELDLARGRLERDVALKSTIFVTLENQRELARIDQAKNLPIVRILDRAAMPSMPVPVPRVALLAAGLIAGMVLSAFAVAALEFWRHLRTQLIGA